VPFYPLTSLLHTVFSITGFLAVHTVYSTSSILSKPSMPVDLFVVLSPFYFLWIFFFFSFLFIFLTLSLLTSTIIHYVHIFLLRCNFLSTRRSTVLVQLQSTPIDHSFQLCASQIFQLYRSPICDSLHFVWSQPMHSKFPWMLKKFTVIYQD
jgi:hypothetical protein